MGVEEGNEMRSLGAGFDIVTVARVSSVEVTDKKQRQGKRGYTFDTFEDAVE